MRGFLIALATTASLASGVASAQSANDMKANPPGDTSGASTGGTIAPSKPVETTGRSSEKK